MNKMRNTPGTGFFALFLMASLFLSACGQLPGAEPRIEGNNKNKGVIAASVTYLAGTRTMNAWFYVRKKGASDGSESIRLAAKPLLSMSGGAGLATMFRNIDFPDTPDRDGRIVAMSLEAGEYELYTWGLHTQVGGSYGNIQPAAPPSPIPFTVSAGSITYLGNLHGQAVLGKNALGLDVPAAGFAEITDKSGRDIPLLMDKFPMLEGWPVSTFRLNGNAWRQQ